MRLLTVAKCTCRSSMWTMHGHGFEVILHASTNIENGDMGVDYDLLDLHWAKVSADLHMRCLNDIPGLENPTRK